MLITRAALALLFVTQVPQLAAAQSVAGRVRDDTGAVLPGVAVLLRTGNSQAVIETVTDALGRYQVRTHEPGPHNLRFSLVNFSQVIRPVTLEAGEAAMMDVAFPLALTAEVTVTGRRRFRNLEDVESPSEGLLGIAGAASKGAVSARQLESLPLSRPGEALNRTRSRDGSAQR